MDKIVKRRKTKKKVEKEEKIKKSKPVKKEKPAEYNYQARKELEAIGKRMEEGREYYIKNSRGGRVYIKNEK